MSRVENNSYLIYLISFFSGFSCLAIEILWVRVLSFVGMSIPQSFSFTLAIFLFGIALGASIGKSLCRNAEVSVHSIGKLFLAAAFVDLIILAIAITFSQGDLLTIIYGGLILISATVRGIVFPVVHHIGANHAKSGKQISNVYFCNVAGSALAPILISFFILDFINTQQTFLLISVLTFVMAFFCISHASIKGLVLKIIAVVTALAVSIVGLVLPEKLFHNLSRDSHYKNTPPIRLIENKHGFIQVYGSQDEYSDSPVTLGNNAYDGRLNTDIFDVSNGIERAYFLATIKPDIKNILVIGLSSGAWVKVLTTMPNVEKITVVEINPAYHELVATEPLVSSLLKDKRVEVIYDDGRKWLNKHKGGKYDLILANTTWHWRAYSTNILSKEFQTLVKSVMHKDSIYYYNSTVSSDAYKTSSVVFPYVYKHNFMVLSSGSPVVVDKVAMKIRLCGLKEHTSGERVFKTEGECEKAAKIMFDQELVPYSKIDFTKNWKNHTPEVITDDNMIPEFKYGRDKEGTT